jgi:hypothetical protein
LPRHQSRHVVRHDQGSHPRAGRGRCRFLHRRVVIADVLEPLLVATWLSTL